MPMTTKQAATTDKLINGEAYQLYPLEKTTHAMDRHSLSLQMVVTQQYMDAQTLTPIILTVTQIKTMEAVPSTVAVPMVMEPPTVPLWDKINVPAVTRDLVRFSMPVTHVSLDLHSSPMTIAPTLAEPLLHVRQDME